VKTIALIGDPVEHSPSPAMHRAAFQALNLDMDYVVDRVRLEELPDVFDGLRERHLGLNVTIPLKEAIVPLLDEVRGSAAATGSVNTVTFQDGRAIGDSTDGEGFLVALRRAGTPIPRRAVILGAGGAARAVGAALRASAADVAITARDPQRGAAAAAALGGRSIAMPELGPELLAADLLVNATPVSDHSPLPAGVALHPGLTVFDLVYRPRVTPLLAAARGLGCRTVEGVEMLVEQGARSFEIWTGLRPPEEAMRDAALAHLEVPA
jgi:shikimate dehydrogenase